MGDHTGWRDLRAGRMRELGAKRACRAAALAYELGRTVRNLREQRGWSQARLAEVAGMTQSAIARFEAGGTIPSLPVLDRLACALEACDAAGTSAASDCVAEPAP